MVPDVVSPSPSSPLGSTLSTSLQSHNYFCIHSSPTTVIRTVSWEALQLTRDGYPRPHPLLKEIHRPTHIKAFAGQTLAVDAYVFLHRGAYGCAQELCLGQPTLKYINYAVERVRLLRYHKVEPYFVFDGGPLPSKRGTEDSREASRKKNLALGKERLALGQKVEAREAFVKALDVTPEMAHQLFKALRAMGVKCLVAPYEADAQLRFLEMHGHVDGIITEDSDLLVYGAKNVLFKLDKEGAVVHICRDDFGKAKGINLTTWSDTQFRHMAILSGCDYLPNIPNFGLKKAYDWTRRLMSADKVIKSLRLEGSFAIPRNYEKEFRRADLTFLHQLVYDPTSKTLVPLHPLPNIPPNLEELSGCGEHFGDDIAKGVAEGKLNPVTRLDMVDIMPGTKPGTGAKPQASGSGSVKRKAEASENLGKGQRTLGNFFTSAPVPKQLKVTYATPPSTALRDVTNIGSTPSTCNSVQSKFFAASLNTLPGVSIEKSKGGCGTEDVPLLEIEMEEGEFEVEDAKPLSQEEWDDASEVDFPDDDLPAVDQEELGEVPDSDFGKDLPSSQMQAPELYDAADENQDSQGNSGIISSPVVPSQSKAKGKRRSFSPGVDQLSSPDAQVSPNVLGKRVRRDQDNEDEEVPEEPEESGDLRTPLINRRVSVKDSTQTVRKPAGRTPRASTSSPSELDLVSDPVDDDFSDEIPTPAHTRQVHEPSKRRKSDPRAAFEPAVANESISPALKKVGQGLRERFLNRRTPAARAPPVLPFNSPATPNATPTPGADFASKLEARFGKTRGESARPALARRPGNASELCKNTFAVKSLEPVSISGAGKAGEEALGSSIKTVGRLAAFRFAG